MAEVRISGRERETVKRRVLVKGITLALRAAFGVLLVGASLDKLAHPFLFANAVENYRIVGENVSYWVAVFLPALECLTGLSLIAGIGIQTAVLVNALLMDLFLAMVAQAAARHLDIACGCFRMGDAAPIGWMKIAQNVCFSFLATVLLLLVWRNVFPPQGRVKKDVSSRTPSPRAGAGPETH